MKSTIGETEGDSSTILLNWDEAEHKDERQHYSCDP